MIIFNKIKLTAILLLICTLTFSQQRDSISYTYYKAGSDATLTLDLQHTELNITTTQSDSIAIYSNINVIPTNPAAPLAGIITKTEQTDSAHVFVRIAVTEEIQPHNEFKAYCNIAVPKGTHLKVNNRYGIANINASESQLDAIIYYTNLTIYSVSQKKTHTITSYYSSINIDHINSLTITGESSNLAINQANKLNTGTKYTIYDIKKANYIKSNTYSDRFILNDVDSVILNGEKSICTINRLSKFMQSETDKGALTIKEIDPGFSTINIANSNVKSQLYFNPKCHFTINADMRYCQLNHESVNLQEVTSPQGKLYKGSYNKSSLSSNVAIISEQGDVSIHIK